MYYTKFELSLLQLIIMILNYSKKNSKFIIEIIINTFTKNKIMILTEEVSY